MEEKLPAAAGEGDIVQSSRTTREGEVVSDAPLLAVSVLLTSTINLNESDESELKCCYGPSREEQRYAERLIALWHILSFIQMLIVPRLVPNLLPVEKLSPLPGFARGAGSPNQKEHTCEIAQLKK